MRGDVVGTHTPLGSINKRHLNYPSVGIRSPVGSGSSVGIRNKISAHCNGIGAWTSSINLRVEVEALHPASADRALQALQASQASARNTVGMPLIFGVKRFSL